MEASALSLPASISRLNVAPPLLRLRSDDQLVALFRAGDENAFQAIYDRYRQRIFAYTRQMLSGSRSDAEDAMQDVFLRAYGALRNNDRPIALRAWLYRVAHNRCIDQLRRPVLPPEDVLEMSRPPLRDPVEESERRANLRQLVADMRELPEQQRSALLMRELDGLSYNELASALDVTIPAVKSLLVRARMGLVEAVEARESACTDIRDELALAHARGVRVSGRSRRHMHGCRDCREYRAALKGLRKSLAALSPSGPLTTLFEMIGLGGSGIAAASGGTSATVGTGAAAGTKVAAMVCCVAVVTGSATEARKTTHGRSSNAAPVVRHAAPQNVDVVVPPKSPELWVSEVRNPAPVDPTAGAITTEEPPVAPSETTGGMAAPGAAVQESPPMPTTDAPKPGEPAVAASTSTP